MRALGTARKIEAEAAAPPGDSETQALEQMRAFLDGPPAWFLVAAVDADLLPSYYRLPASVIMPGGGIENIEWTDAIYAATALSRHEPPHSRCYFQTQDTRLVRIELIAEHCV